MTPAQAADLARLITRGQVTELTGQQLRDFAALYLQAHETIKRGKP